MGFVTREGFWELFAGWICLADSSGGANTEVLQW